MFAYVDETGNTGARLLDDDQPLFITAALMTRSNFDTRFGAQVRELARRFDDDELHASKLGVGRLEQIAPDLLSTLRRAGPSFFVSIVEKRYVLGTKAFHTLLDPAENRAVPTQIFLMRPVHMTMAFKFAWLLDEKIAQLFWDALMEVNANRAREKLIQFCGRVLERVERLPDARSREVIGEGLTWAMANPEAIDIFSEDKVARQGHLPNTVGFGNLLAGVETQSTEWSRPVEVIRHDRQSEFAASLGFWHDFYANAGADFIDMPLGERVMLRRVFGSRLEITSARDSAGIQVTGVILWLLSRSLRGQDLPPAASRSWTMRAVEAGRTSSRPKQSTPTWLPRLSEWRRTSRIRRRWPAPRSCIRSGRRTGGRRSRTILRQRVQRLVAVKSNKRRRLGGLAEPSRANRAGLRNWARGHCGNGKVVARRKSGTHRLSGYLPR